MAKEKLLAGLFTNYSFPGGHREHVERYSEANRKAFLEVQAAKWFQAGKGSLLGWDIVVEKDRLFNIPRWWDFRANERGWLLAKSLELIQKFGFLNYFLQLADSLRDGKNLGTVRDELVKSQGKSEGLTH